MNTKLASAIVVSFSLIATGHAQTNSWIKTTNGFWEVNTSWSLGTPPTYAQTATFITNANSKVISVDNEDATVYYQTCELSNLVLSAPLGFTNSFGITNMNLGFTSPPFVIFNTLTISTGGALLVYNSQLQFKNLSTNVHFIDGAIQLDNNASILATNNALEIVFGNVGRGSLTVNSGLTRFGSVYLAYQPGSAGTLNFAGGTNNIAGLLALGLNQSNTTGTVWMTGGQLSVAGSTLIGFNGVGEMIVSGGTWFASGVYIPYPGARGMLSVAGGTTTISSSLTIGTTQCGDTGIVVMAGGSLYVTNSSGTAVLEVQSGTLTISGGTLRADKIILTNACSHFVRTGGTLIYGTAVLNPNDDTDGDGLRNGYEQSHGLDPLDPINATKDSDGDGVTDLQEFLAGTDPTNSASMFRITSVIRTNNDVRITWRMGSGKTNALQRTAGEPDGSYSTNNFTDIFTVTNTVGTVTNYLDIGAAINFPSRFYRVRLVQ